MKGERTPREDVRTSPYKRTPTKSTLEPEVPQDVETQQSEPSRLTFFPPHKGKTLEELEREGNGRVIDWIKKKDLGAKYPDLKELWRNGTRQTFARTSRCCSLTYDSYQRGAFGSWSSYSATYTFEYGCPEITISTSTP
jgi:hypothetical protein